MRPHLADWVNEVKASAPAQPVPTEIAVPLAPLLQRLKRYIESLPPAQRAQAMPLEFYREALKGRQGNKAHAGELGACLRKLGYTRRRAWDVQEDGFRALWSSPK